MEKTGWSESLKQQTLDEAFTGTIMKHTDGRSGIMMGVQKGVAIRDLSNHPEFSPVMLFTGEASKYLKDDGAPDIIRFATKTEMINDGWVID